ncbi:MAG: TolC family protein [Calditrichaeota bacterium]|nr:TolC family protein [Calditrichota bacterium]
MRKLSIFSLLMSTWIFLSCASYQTTVQQPEPGPLLSQYVPAGIAHQPVAKDTLTFEEPTGTLTLKQALSLALLKNPELQAFSYEIRTREALALQASLLPNPELDIEVENFAGGKGVQGFEATETTFQISQLILLAGKRAKRTRAAVLEADLAAQEYEVMRTLIFKDVVQAYVAVLAAQEKVALNQELLRIAQAFVESIDRRVRAGKISPAEAARARVALSNTELQLEQSRIELAAAKQQLAATWGSDRPAFDRVVGKLDTITATLPPQEALEKLLLQNPLMVRQALAIKQRQATLALERANRIPDGILSAGIRQLNEINTRAFVMGLSIPLTIFDRNQGMIQAARYQVLQARQQKRATEIQLKSQLAESYARLKIAHSNVLILRNKILPQAQKAFDTIQEGYLMGKFDFLDVLDAQRTLFEVRARYLDALQQYHASVAEVETLINQPLTEVSVE